MIFVTMGIQKFQFNRLLAMADAMIEAGEINDEVLAQVGCSDYVPSNYPLENTDRIENKGQILWIHI